MPHHQPIQQERKDTHCRGHQQIRTLQRHPKQQKDLPKWQLQSCEVERENTRSPAKKKTKPARQQKQENSNFHFVNNCPDCKFAQLTNNQCFDCGIPNQQAKTTKKSTSKNQSQPKIARKATTDYFQKLTSATKNLRESTESFISNLNFNKDAIYEEKEGENKQENDFQYNKNLDDTEYNFNKIKDAKEGAIYIAQTLHSDRTLFAIIFNFIEKAENAMTIMSREKPSSTSKTKAEISTRILADVYKNWRETTERLNYLSAKRTRTSKNNNVLERRMLKSLICIDEQIFDDTDHRRFIASSNKTGQNAHRNRMKRNKNVPGKQNNSNITRKFPINAQIRIQNHSRCEINVKNAFVAYKNDEIVQDLINCYQKVLQNSYNTKNDEPLEESSEKRPFEYQKQRNDQNCQAFSTNVKIYDYFNAARKRTPKSCPIIPKIDLNKLKSRPNQTKFAQKLQKCEPSDHNYISDHNGGPTNTAPRRTRSKRNKLVTSARPLHDNKRWTRKTKKQTKRSDQMRPENGPSRKHSFLSYPRKSDELNEKKTAILSQNDFRNLSNKFC